MSSKSMLLMALHPFYLPNSRGYAILPTTFSPHSGNLATRRTAHYSGFKRAGFSTPDNQVEIQFSERSEDTQYSVLTEPPQREQSDALIFHGNKKDGIGQMPNLINDFSIGYGERDGNMPKFVNAEESVLGNVVPAVLGLLLIIGATWISQHPTLFEGAQALFTNPTNVLDEMVSRLEAMGPSGVLYFAIFYVVAEVLAIPATPLTASAGYLFGVEEGTAVVLASASVAAGISFWIGRTFLREKVESILEGYPKFKALDKAIGREGFKLMLLIRLSPLFPFALSNYLYGATSVRFAPYFWGTVLGFLPGTLAYVYTGTIGKALMSVDGSAEPWYVYAGGLAVLGGFIKLASGVASRIVEDIEAAEES